jgi:hypothetical protein
MLRLKPRYKLHVPHGLAILGAILLLTSTAAGIGGAWQAPARQSVADTADFVSGRESDVAETSSDSVETIPQAPGTSRGRFKMNLFLFRR